MKPLLDDRVVGLVRESAAYAKHPPYHPSDAYPEWPGATVGSEDNPAYRGVRALFQSLGMDAVNAGTAGWNPLRELVRPGQHVVLKPNFVSHRNLLDPVRGDTDCLITHGSVIRVVLDYVAKALGERGRITIADCPIQSTDWTALLDVVGLPQVVEDARARFPGLAIEIVDARLATAVVRRGGAVERADRAGVDATELELGADSLLVPITRPDVDFGVTHYGRRRMKAAHTASRHAYLIGRVFLDCDVLINLPKLKAHQKAGVTCALKNLVGINAHKDYLPHFRFGAPREGGDEYPDGNWYWTLLWRMRHREWEHERGPRKRLWALAAGATKQLLPLLAGLPRAATALGGGAWRGNDTLWRTVLDVNRAFFYGRRESAAVGTGMNPRRYFAIVDGLVGGDRESPLFPSRVNSGVLLAGQNPAAVDVVATEVMGFDWRRVPQIRQAFELLTLPLASFRPTDVVIRGTAGVSSLEDVPERFERFTPSAGFRGHLERVPTSDRRAPTPADAGAGRESPVDA